jgi:hypothetical protein
MSQTIMTDITRPYNLTTDSQLCGPWGGGVVGEDTAAELQKYVLQ